jgi:hypothetical protein
MHHSDASAYNHFAAFIAKNHEADNRECIQHVMRASAGTADPGRITDWWHQWRMIYCHLGPDLMYARAVLTSERLKAAQDIIFHAPAPPHTDSPAP